MTPLYVLSELTASFIEIFVGLLFINLLLRNQNPLHHMYPHFILHSVILTVLVSLCNYFSLFSMINMFLVPIYLCVLISSLYKVNPFLSFSLVSFYAFMIHLIDGLYILSAGILLHRTDFASVISDGYSVTRLIFLLIVKLILICSFLIARHLSKFLPDFKYHPSYYVILAVLSYIGILYLIYLTFHATDVHTLFYWILFGFTQISILLTLFLYLKYQKEKEQQYIIGLRNSFLEESNQKISVLYENDRKIRHDLYNNLICIKHLICTDHTDDALEVLNGILNPLLSYDNVTYTNNASIDFILNYKKTEARQSDIAFHITAEFHPNNHIDDKDICTILFNLIDNAIETCQKIPNSSSRNIRLSMRHVHDMYLIKIENSCLQSPFNEANQLLTSKKDTAHHGIGIKTVRSIVEQYNGDINFAYADHTFSVILSLF